VERSHYGILPNITTVNVGDSVEFQCYSGYASATWYFNGGDLPNNSQKEENNDDTFTWLRIYNSNVDNGGCYSCAVEKMLVIRLLSAKLDVKGKFISNK